MKSREFLQEIRKSTALERAVLKKITVQGQAAIFHLVTDKTYSQDDITWATRIAAQFVPAGFTAEVRLFKSVPDPDAVRRTIAEVLKVRFPAAAAFVTPQDIEVVRDETGGRFLIMVDSAESRQFTAGNILDCINGELQRQYCGSWFGDVKLSQKQKGEIEQEAPPPEEYIFAPRMFEIVEYVPIDGAAPKHAVYIADIAGEMQSVAICGAITFMEERQTKNGKPYFSITVADASGQMRIAYFTKKATLEKVRGLKSGDNVCVSGDNELYNGNYSFRAKAIDFGMPPKNFVMQERPARPAPARYSVVFPEPVNDYVQPNLFGEKPLPPDLVGREFVVFDLETTGLNNTPAAGAMDRIIEVGAVRIKDGRICEKFSSFVACPVKLSAEIVSLTGIDDSMLVGAPDIKQVIADFKKFSDGCALVGHNVQFDYKFIRYYGEQEGYSFDQKQYDTVSLSQQLLSLSNHKLDTVAEHFGFTFNHHRAFDDAFVTAKIFIELIKLKGKL